MGKVHFFFVVFFLFLFSLPFISSNFVCGFVNDSQEFSSSWTKVIIYPDEDHSNIIPCEVSPENKFCCDLDELPFFNYLVGKKIFAEIFDEEGGFVAGPVDLLLTGEGYDLFSQMNLQKAITINSPSQRIFANESSSSVVMNLSLAEHYNNLRYTLNSAEGFSQEDVCTDCSNPVFSIPFNKGKNELKLIAYNENREISEDVIFYNLDYLNFNIDVFCEKCKIKNDFFYIPSNENITFTSSFNASHNISGDFLFYFPSDWILFNSSNLEDFSTTHKILSENITDKKEFSVNYSLQSPKTFIKKEYTFYQKFENQEQISKVVVFKFKIIPFRKSKYFDNHYFNSPFIQRGSPTQPIILNSKEDYLKLVAIYPKLNIFNSHSNLIFSEKKKRKNLEYFFTISTTILQKNIDKIFLLFKVEKGKSIEVYSNNHKINLEFYEEDPDYTYYSAYVHEKGPFSVKIS